MKLAPKIKDIKNPNIPKDTQGTYPKAWTQINSLSDRLNDRKYAAYKKRCHADKATVDGAFNRFSPPDLVIVYFGPGKDGQINKDTGGNPELNEILINAFRKGLITGQQLDRVVEHEFAHWLQDAWLKANPGEMRGHGDVGNDYESDVYGGNPFIPDYSLFCRKL